jgi:hypothetical protein
MEFKKKYDFLVQNKYLVETIYSIPPPSESRFLKFFILEEKNSKLGKEQIICLVRLILNKSIFHVIQRHFLFELF